MDKIYIIYTNYLNEDEKTRSIGGIQTYISDLCGALKKIRVNPFVIQKSNHDFKTEIDGINVIGIHATLREFPSKAISNIEKNQIVIWGSHELIKKYEGYSLAIQHGITWDVPHEGKNNELINSVMIFRRAFQAYKLQKKIKLINELICVDYNFLNWYRTQVAHLDVKTTVIPNYAIVSESPKKNSCNQVKIIFARRLFWYRGTRIFTNAILTILDKYPEVIITIAGEGPDEDYMRTKLKNYKNVEFIKYKSSDSIKIHSDQDIAVIPTIGSEGTSLSLLEAMVSGCAVVASNVGGMTNIVIDNYNGLIINPQQEELENSLIRLIESKELRDRLALAGFNTVKTGFSKEIWEQRWKKIICNIIRQS